MKLQDKVAIITGGTRGIGLEIVRRFLAEGARVALVGTRDETVAKAVAEFPAVSADRLRGYALDVSDSAAVNAVFTQVLADFGALDILVNNAGITKDGLLMRMKDDDFDKVISINLKGSFNCLKAAVRPMMSARRGRIINISSVVGLTGNAGQANYAASKAGLLGLTMSAAKELASRNITVNSVCPGFIATEMTHVVSEEAKQAFLRNIPLGRPGEGHEVASLCVFLASDEAAYITGQAINVDGGMVM